MEAPLVVGVSVAAAALGGRYLLTAWQAFKARPVVPRMRRFYEGGFERAMTRREAALILGVREHAVLDKIKEAHRRVMVANHPDSGGSHYLASKINEAKDMLMGKKKRRWICILEFSSQFNFHRFSSPKFGVVGDPSEGVLDL